MKAHQSFPTSRTPSSRVAGGKHGKLNLSKGKSRDQPSATKNATHKVYQPNAKSKMSH